jgi:hypothetical protein
MAGAGIPLAIAGTAFSVYSQYQAGRLARLRGQLDQQAHERNAAEMEINAGQAIAASQRDSLEARRLSEITQSRALAVAAASGAGASDPTVMNFMARNAGEGAYHASVALYRGEESARKLRSGASMERYSGEVAAVLGRSAQRASYLGMAGSFFQGGSMLSRYGGGGFGSPSITDTSGETGWQSGGGN